MTWCGSYCAISIVWDKLKCEGEVDLFSAMRTVKMNRPQLISSMVSCRNNNIMYDDFCTSYCDACNAGVSNS